MIGGGSDIFAMGVMIDLIDNFSGGMLAPIARLEQFETTIFSAGLAMEGMMQGAAIAASGLAIAAPLAIATGKAIELEDAFADVKKVMGDVPQVQLSGLQNDLIALTRTLPLTATELTQIAAEASQAGIPFAELTGFVEDAAKMSVAFGISAQQSGQSMAALKNIFQTSQAGVLDISDAMNKLGDSMNSTSSDILNVVTRVGSFGKTVGLTAPQISAFASALLSTNTPVEVVGTGLTALFRKLGAAEEESKPFHTALEGLGYSAKGLEATLRKDALGGIRDFLGEIAKSKDQLGVLTELFGAEYADDIAKLTGNLGSLDQALAVVGEKSNYAGSMQSEFQNRMGTAKVQTQLFYNALDELWMLIGNQILPTFKDVIQSATEIVQGISDFAKANPQLVSGLIAVSGAASAALIGIGGFVFAINAVKFGSVQTKMALEFLGWQFGGFGMSTKTASVGVMDFIGDLHQVRPQVLFTAAEIRGLGFAMSGLSWRSMGAGAVNALMTILNPVKMVRLGFDALKISGMLAMSGVSGAANGLMGALRGVFVFMAANPVIVLAGVLIGLGAAFIYAWNNVKEFRDNVMIALQPLMDTFGELKASVVSLLNQFGGIGDWISEQLGGIDIDKILGAVAYGIGFFLGFTLTLFVLIFARIASVVVQSLGGVVDFIDGIVQTVIGLFTGDMNKALTGVQKIFWGIVKVISAPLQLLGIDWDLVKSSLQAVFDYIADWMIVAGNKISTWWGNLFKQPALPTLPNVNTGETSTTRPSSTPAPPSTGEAPITKPSPATTPTPTRVPEVAIVNTELNPLPKLETNAKVNTILEPLQALETSANVSPNLKALEPITPTLNPLPKLETDAKINTILEPLKALQATAEVTANLNSLPTLEGSANVRTGIESTQLFKTKLEKPERLERQGATKNKERPVVQQTNHFTFTVPTTQNGQKVDMDRLLEEVKRQFVPMLTEALELEPA
jgi:TP901 family phage tail tape measure protein